MNKVNLILLFVLITLAAHADHYFGGYFYYESTADKELRVTLVTFTDDHNDVSDRDSVLFNWGDGNKSFIVRINDGGDSLYQGMRKNIYQGTHSYAKYSNFQSYFSDNFRLFDVDNMEIGMSGVTNLRFDGIAPVQDSTVKCTNNSPQPQCDPYFFGKAGQPFHLNLCYFDHDGDSLHYQLGNCKQANGDAAAGYYIPNGVNINASTGDFTWDNPSQGKYCFSIVVDEYREETLIGSSSSDFTLFIDRSSYWSLPTGSGSTINQQSFSSLEQRKVAFQYQHSEADSVACKVISKLEEFGFQLNEKVETTSGIWKDSLSIYYDGTGAFQGVNSIAFECMAYWGKDTAITEHFLVPVSVDNYPFANCEDPNLDNIEDQAPELPSLSIAPNLFDDHVWINLGSNYDNASLYIFDMRGRLVRIYENIAGQTFKMDLANLSSAMYLVQVYVNDEVIYFDKMVKR